MQIPSRKTKRSRSLAAMYFLSCFSMVIAILYFGREILLPIALAILVTFILAPIVNHLRKLGAGQLFSVIITVGLALGVLGTIGTVIAIEFKGLANELPAYRENIRQKIADIRSASKNESLSKVKAIAQEISAELKQEEPPVTQSQNKTNLAGTTNAPVVVKERTTIMEDTPALNTFMEVSGSVGLVVVLVIFMLLRREDLRDRLLHLGGRERLVATTKAVEEIGEKVSRYLVRQCFLNSIYGMGIALGLFIIGLPYAMLWGFLAAVARFIPYAGPVLGAVAPILMSLAVFDSWSSPFIVISLILGWELVNNMILEPVIYGQGIGVSEVALLIMMAFWTWLWGPLGLVLAAPLTVCMVVICKGVPELRFISLLLGSKAALTPQHALYQRLVANNYDEARLFVQDFLKKHSRDELFETMLLPVLRICREDRTEHRLSARIQQQVLKMLRRLLEEFCEQPKSDERKPCAPVSSPLIVGCPAMDATDEMALALLAEMLSVEQVDMPVISGNLENAKKIAEILALKPAVLCVGGLMERDTYPARELCQQLQQKLPSMTIVLSCLGSNSTPADLPDTNTTNDIKTTLTDTKTKLLLQAKESSALRPHAHNLVEAS